ncbi:uracil-xanthine permease family protein [Tetragenococcus halophilus]|uniref:uracil-xanthine permease family protein n=1 Tax=Tetragenococcus halophilus TaxID=51669 RepID=UPI000CC55693|nr:nucleobase:cation symporter-2 family protein [Tetragenococcus halophilus]RQD29397.1 purine permease [Tetragenococcus halophilus subsp. halophilus DSM 20339]GBD59445.1 putative xanthine/uracil permease [Tetragenococcus halophilus subsp. halophilus]GMA45408.1 xanthine/uracil permease [Tetragenococcus halophilus subsp. halophilus DSM 20339]
MESKKELNALYKYDAKPQFGEILSLGLQHVVAAIVGIVTPGLMIAEVTNLNEANTTLILQTSLVFAGITTLIQLFPIFGRFGARLPVMMGASFAYVPILLAIGAEFGIGAIFGAQLIGGLTVIFVGLTIKKIRFIFPPIVTGTVILSIGFSLFPVAVKYMAGGAGNEGYGSWQSWLVAIITFVIVFYLNNFGRGFLKLSSMLVGMIIGYIVSLFLGMVDFVPIANAGIVQSILPLHFGLEFKAVPIATLVVMYLVDSVQTIGQFTATTFGAMDRQPTDKEISGAIIGSGLANFLGSLFGSVPCATFGQNVGLAVSTKAINKYIFTFASGVLLIAGFLPKIAAILTTIPQSVIGGATISVFATIAMTGLRTVANEGLTPKNTTVVGTSLAFGIGIALSEGSLAGFPAWVTTIFGNSEVILTAIIAVILNLILNKPKPEKILQE